MIYSLDLSNLLIYQDSLVKMLCRNYWTAIIPPLEKGGKGGFMDYFIVKSPLTPLFQRGVTLKISKMRFSDTASKPGNDKLRYLIAGLINYPYYLLS